MRRHFQYWGAAWILLSFFIVSWTGQAYTMWSEVQAEGWTKFWAASFENWQSEWLQLFVQAVLVLALGHHLFKADKADMEEVQDRLRDVQERLERMESSGSRA